MERLSRRKILGAAGALAGGSALAGAAVAGTPAPALAEGIVARPVPVGAEAGDAHALALFDEWLEVTRAADRLNYAEDDDPLYQAMVDRMNDIENEIMVTPGGPAALAIKCFFFLRQDCLDNWCPDSTYVRFPELFEGEPGRWDAAVVGIIRDAATHAPVLAELAAPIIHDDAALIDADMDVQWCRERLAQPFRMPPDGDEEFVRWLLDNHARRQDERRVRLAKMLDRIASTEAKTARGAAIKAKHAIRAEGLA